MNKKALATLEFNKIISELISLADSPTGKELCKKTAPQSELSTIENMQLQTTDALSRIYRHGAPSFRSVKDIKGSFLRLEVGSVIGTGELLAVSSLLECAQNARSYNSETTDSLTRMFDTLNCAKPYQALFFCHF